MDAKLGAVRIRNLVDEKKATIKGLSVNKMLIELSLDTSIVDNMRKGHMPSADKLDPIARYLETSVAYLLGETDDRQPTGELAIKLTDKIARLSSEDIEKALEYVEMLEMKRKHQEL